MSNALAKNYSFGSLVKFAMPNIIMMIFLSMYTIVDGIFVSRYVGTTALSAINMVYPAVSIQMAIGIMLATGGSAIIARKLGEGKDAEAKSNFSQIILIVVSVGFAVALLGNLFLDDIIRLLGASEKQFALCQDYARILFCFAPFFFLQTSFQVLFVTAGNPKLGLIAIGGAGITNIVLDYVFVGLLDWGIGGAALATGIGYTIPAIVGLCYFSFSKKSLLRFVKPVWDGRMLLFACGNGSSEMVSNLANAITTFLYNYQFMRLFGENGVAAITIVLYFEFVFAAIFFGYSMGVSPVFSYKYGCRDGEQLQKIFKSSITFVLICSVLSFVSSRIIIEPALSIFTDNTSSVFALAISGFPLFSIAFLLMGMNIFSSAMFTAFSDGITSAIISFARTFLFLAGAILVLPSILGKPGVWLAMPTAEALGCIVSIVFLVWKRSAFPYTKTAKPIKAVQEPNV